MNPEHDYLWDPAQPPDADVERLERALGQFRHQPQPFQPDYVPARRTRWHGAAQRHPAVFWAIAASVLLLAGGWAYVSLSRPRAWSVATLSGNPKVAGNASPGVVAAGARVETDSRSAARIAVGRIGIADLAPDSRVDVVRDDRGEHRLALRYGTIHASIWARPRFFVVTTPSATAIDLGCVYSLSVDSAGFGQLAVGFGEVELASGGRDVLIAAGMAARVYPDRIGAPIPISASQMFRDAVFASDTGVADAAALGVVLRESDAQGTATLWHLLRRTDDVPLRRKIYERIAALVPPPSGVTADAVAALDSSALARWEIELRPHWSSEPHSFVRRQLVRLGVLKPAAILELRRQADWPVARGRR